MKIIDCKSVINEVTFQPCLEMTILVPLEPMYDQQREMVAEKLLSSFETAWKEFWRDHERM
jgi:hypothetical protein